MRRKFLFLVVAMVIAASLCVFAACDNGSTSGKDGGMGLESDESLYFLSDGLYNGMTVSGSCLTSYSGDATELVIPSGVTSIGERAFYGCSKLTRITMSGSVTNIGICAFSGCSGLTSITVESGNTKYHASGNCLIETATKTLIVGCNNSVIPTDGSVTSIAEYAFNDCGSLTSITIPNSVTSIGAGAFA